MYTNGLKCHIFCIFSDAVILEASPENLKHILDYTEDEQSWNLVIL